MSDKKVYRNPAIALVAVEVRHSGTDPVSESGFEIIRQRLRPQWPLQVPGQDIAVDFGSNGPSPIVVEYQRFTSRDRRTAITIRPGSTTVETVDYKGWEHLRLVAKSALEARAEVSDPAGYERVGLRYINEVRLQDETAIDWAAWMHPSLLAAQPDDELGLPLSDWVGMSTFGPAEGSTLVLRYGPRVGYAVEPNGALKRASSPTGPFFLLDFDSFWEASDDTPEFEVDELVARCDSLHTPVRRLFEGLITGRLRKEVLDG